MYVEGVLRIGCGCNNYFNYDGKPSVDVIAIDKWDSLVVEVSPGIIANRKLSIEEFWKLNKIIIIDYYLSNYPLAFKDRDFIYEDFMRYKRRGLAVIPGSPEGGR